MNIARGLVLAMLPALVALSVPAQVGATSLRPARERVVLDDWRLAVTTDRFSGEHRCRLTTRKGNVSYDRGLISIRLPRIANPSEAIIRVDGGAPVRWRDLIPELARRDPGFAMGRHPRELLIPPEQLKSARAVWVSPAFGKHARAYRIAGFTAAMKRAFALGCRTDAAFVR